jgi:nitrogen fixation NifU-like protein
MPEISGEELEELRRLTLVEQSVMAGLREGGFSEKALEFFRYRKNFLLPDDPLKDMADVVGKFTGACGDHVDIYLKIDQDIIKDAKFLTDGCPGAVTSASALIEMIKGESTTRASELKVPHVVGFLKEGAKGLPKNMHDCCGIAIGALRDAIARYKQAK